MDNEKQSELNDAETNAFSADAEAPKLYTKEDEEFAAEVADGAIASPRMSDDRPIRAARSRTESTDRGRGWGITAIVMAIASWFIWPTVLAPAAMIIGFIAFTRGRRALGGWSIALGMIAFIFYLAAAPFFRT